MELCLRAKVAEEPIQRSRKEEARWSLTMTSSDGDRYEQSMSALERVNGVEGKR